MSIEKEIRELSQLYAEMTKRYREITAEYVDEETAIEHAVLEDIKNYLHELLKVLPKSVTVFCLDRLTIHMLKNEFYENEEGQAIQTDAIAIGDSKVYEDCMTLDNEWTGMKFCGFENASACLNLRTLEFMCAEWKAIKEAIHRQTMEELDSFIRKRMEQMKEKTDKLHNFKDWEA